MRGGGPVGPGAEHTPCVGAGAVPASELLSHHLSFCVIAVAISINTVSSVASSI